MSVPGMTAAPKLYPSRSGAAANAVRCIGQVRPGNREHSASSRRRLSPSSSHPLERKGEEMKTGNGNRETIPAEGTVPAEGIELYYRSVGSGTPVITVHGGPGLGHAYLRPGMDALADRFRVVYYDQRGSGRSELGDPDRVTLAGGIEDLKALVDGLGIERANLVGHSFGADLAALFASRHPDRVASMVLANPGPPFDPDQQGALGAKMDRRRTPEDLAELGRIQGSEVPYRLVEADDANERDRGRACDVLSDVPLAEELARFMTVLGRRSVATVLGA